MFFKGFKRVPIINVRGYWVDILLLPLCLVSKCNSALPMHIQCHTTRSFKHGVSYWIVFLVHRRSYLIWQYR